MFPLVPQPQIIAANELLQPGVYAAVGVLLFLCFLNLTGGSLGGYYGQRKATLGLIEFALAIATLIIGWWLIVPLLFLLIVAIVVLFVEGLVEAIKVVFKF